MPKLSRIMIRLAFLHCWVGFGLATLLISRKGLPEFQRVEWLRVAMVARPCGHFAARLDGAAFDGGGLLDFATLAGDGIGTGAIWFRGDGGGPA